MKRLSISFVLVLFVYKISAQSTVGGEITYTHLSGFTYQLNITVYSFDSAIQEIIPNWGDGTIDTLTNSGNLTDSVFYSLFNGIHTFPGLGTYAINVSVPYLSPFISNVEDAATKKLYLLDTLIILDPAFYGYNSSPTFFDNDYEIAAINESFSHSLDSYDSDGDSLSFTMISYPVTGYSFPPATDSIAFTGLLVWEKPNVKGNFLITTLIREWRFGAMVGSMFKIYTVQVIESEVLVPEIYSSFFSEISPNPTTHFIQLHLLSSPTFLSIFNLLGEKVKEQKVTTLEVTMDVSELPAGMYVVRTEDSMMGKFVKLACR